MRTPLTLALLLLPALAWPQDDVVRRALIGRATQARDRGEHAQALALAREAASLRMSTSLRTFIAQEYAALGQDDLAVSHARTCVREAEADPALPNGAALLAECRALIDRLARPQAASPVAPLPAEAPAVVEPRRPSAPALVDPWRDVPTTHARDAGPGPGPWVVIASGAALFGAAGVLFALREGALDDRDAWCAGRSPCELEAQSAVDGARAAQDHARTYNLLTNVALGVGGAALGAGILWLLLGQRSSDARPTVAVGAAPQGGVLLGVRGAL